MGVKRAFLDVKMSDDGPMILIDNLEETKTIILRTVLHNIDANLLLAMENRILSSIPAELENVMHVDLWSIQNRLDVDSAEDRVNSGWHLAHGRPSSV